MSQFKQTEPRASRPLMPEGYGVPAGEEGMLPWSWAAERLSSARNYWIGTTRPDGRPHAMPVWGVWVDNVFYFGTDPTTQNGRNLAANPAITVHLESGDEVVILEGRAEAVNVDGALRTRIEDAYEAKYQMRDTGNFAVRPRVGFAWSKFPDNATRWYFDAE